MKKSDIRKLDKLFSLFIRKRGYCQRCGKTTNLHTSHVLPKGKYPSLRFHPNNAIALCLYDHLYWWHKNPIEAAAWFSGVFPEQHAWALEQKKRPGKVPTKETVLQWWKEFGWSK